MTMPYKDLSSQYPSIKGIAVELPFVKFKYMKVDSVQPERSRNTRQINVTVPPEDRPPTSTSRVIFSREAEATTMGIDGMISYASVVHELAYGRIEAMQDVPRTSEYPAFLEPRHHSLDIII